MSAKKKADVPAELVDRLAGAAASRATANRTADTVHAVGALPDLTADALKKFIAPAIKSLLAAAANMAGDAAVDLAEEHAEKLEAFVPDEVYRLIERIAHELHGGDPHVVGKAPAPEPEKEAD